MDPRLLSSAKKLAAETNRTLTAIIEDAVREAVTRRHRPARRAVSLTIVGGHGVRPGVDLDDSAALLALMDGDDGPA